MEQYESNYALGLSLSSPGLFIYLIINCITLFIKGIVGVNLSARFHSTSIIDMSLNRIPVCRLSVFALKKSSLELKFSLSKLNDSSHSESFLFEYFLASSSVKRKHTSIKKAPDVTL